MRAAILTNLSAFNSGHSLVSVVSDQVTMLRKYGHDVEVFVGMGARCNGEMPTNRDAYRFLVPVIDRPIDYGSEQQISATDKDFSRKLANLLTDILTDEIVSFDCVFTHDWIFGGRHLPYAEAIRLACEKSEELRSIPWLHWVHSVPTLQCDWWDLGRYQGNHTIIYPNDARRVLVSEMFRTEMARVRAVPHVRDLRTLRRFDPESVRLIDDYPGLMQADVVQVYPASRDRLSAKQVDILVKLFATLKRKGKSVCLCIADQLATGIAKPQDLEPYNDLAERWGLTEQEFFFTSEWQNGRYSDGLPWRILGDIEMLMNLFVFPTIAESFGLVLPEASLCSGCLVVLNDALPEQSEIGGNQIALDFGSYLRQRKPRDETQWLDSAANLILSRLTEEKAVASKTWHRQQYNLDAVWRRYEALLTELGCVCA